MKTVLPILMWTVVLLTAGPSLAQTTISPEKERPQTSASPTAATLVVWNRPIVVFRAQLRQVTPAARATIARQRLDALPGDIRPDEIQASSATVGDVHGVMVFARGRILFSIVADDLDSSTGESLDDASRRSVEALRTAFQARAEQRRPVIILWGLALSLGAAVALAAVLLIIGRQTGRILGGLAEATHTRTVSMLGVDLRPFLSGLQRGLVKLTAWGLGLVAAYLWLTFALHQFPYTRPWAERLTNYLLELLGNFALGVLQAIPGLFAVVVIFVATRFVTRIVDVLFQATEKGVVQFGALQPDTARATRRITAVLIWMFAITVAYQYIPGSDTDAFKAVGVFAGLMVSLGSAGLVNQVMSGLVVIYSRALRPGELVRAGETIGLVREVGLLSTKIAAEGEEITIPNAVLVGTTVTNYSRLSDRDGPLISTSVTIGYDAPWRQVHAMLLRAAERTARIRRQPGPYVLQRALSDFYVQYELRAHLESPEGRARVLSELHTNILDVFNEYGVQIMSPAFEGQPDQPVVVPKSRWHAAPATPEDGKPPKT